VRRVVAGGRSYDLTSTSAKSPTFQHGDIAGFFAPALGGPPFFFLMVQSQTPGYSFSVLKRNRVRKLLYVIASCVVVPVLRFGCETSHGFSSLVPLKEPYDIGAIPNFSYTGTSPCVLFLIHTFWRPLVALHVMYGMCLYKLRKSSSLKNVYCLSALVLTPLSFILFCSFQLLPSWRPAAYPVMTQ